MHGDQQIETMSVMLVDLVHRHDLKHTRKPGFLLNSIESLRCLDLNFYVHDDDITY
jgi:hypothetical protein